MTHFLYWTQEDSHSQAEDWGEPDCKMLFHGNMTEILMKGSQLSRAVSSSVPWRYSPLADILSVWRREKNPFLLAYYTSDKGQGLSEVVTHTTTEVGYVILKLFSSNFFYRFGGPMTLCLCSNVTNMESSTSIMNFLLWILPWPNILYKMFNSTCLSLNIQ